MVKLEYSQIVRRKLKALREELAETYGENSARKIMSNITKAVRRLETFPKSGTRVSLQYELECDYYYIFAQHNYFFYIIKDDQTVLILEMFHEKEDFMRKLFGVITTTQETINYWGE